MTDQKTAPNRKPADPPNAKPDAPAAPAAKVAGMDLWVLLGISGAVSDTRSGGASFGHDGLTHAAGLIAKEVLAKPDAYGVKAKELIDQFGPGSVECRVYRGPLPSGPFTAVQQLRPLNPFPSILFAPFDIDTGYGIEFGDDGTLAVVVLAAKHVYPRKSKSTA
jgi:hypothetical protein